MGRVGVRATSSEEKVGRRGTAFPTNWTGRARSPFRAHYLLWDASVCGSRRARIKSDGEGPPSLPIGSVGLGVPSAPTICHRTRGCAGRVEREKSRTAGDRHPYQLDRLGLESLPRPLFVMGSVGVRMASSGGKSDGGGPPSLPSNW